MMHPKYCPSVLARSEEKKRLRRCKALVLPQLVYADLQEAAGHEPRLDFRPRISLEKRFGRLGRIMVLRYNPKVGSSSPVGQVLLRCNLDVQCMTGSLS